MGNNYSYSDEFFQAIDTILKERLNQVKYDKTSVCTIVSQDENDKTKYWVTDGSLRFEAFSNSVQQYATKSQVYVLIPEGKYENRKIILGKYTSDKEDSAYQQGTENIQLKAFDDFISACILVDLSADTNFKNPQANYYSSDIDLKFHGLGGFTQLGVEFSINSFEVFQSAKIYSGSYGLFFTFKDSNGETLGKTVLDSSQLYGNPYMLTHNQLFKIVLPFDNTINPYTIKNLTIDFYYRDNENLKNITISNFKLYLGYSTEDIRKKLSELSSTNGLIAFLPSGAELKYPLKQDEDIYINWVIEENDKYKIYNNTQSFNNSNYEIAWGQYQNAYQGKNNTLTEIEQALGIYYKDITTREVEVEGGETTEIKDTWLKSFNNSMFDSKQPTISFKVAILQKNEDTSYTSIASNPFYFTNEDLKVEAGASNGVGDSLRLTLKDGDDGVYNIYGNDNRIIDSSYSGTVTMSFLNEALNNDQSATFTVTWKIPTSGTQIAAPEGWAIDGNYYIYSSNNNKTLVYGFKDIYNMGATNNKIICEVTNHSVETDTIFYGSIDLHFGMASTSGTDFNFYITANKKFVTQNDSELKLIPHLKTLNGDTIELTESDDIIWDVIIDESITVNKENLGLPLTTQGNTEVSISTSGLAGAAIVTATLTRNIGYNNNTNNEDDDKLISTQLTNYFLITYWNNNELWDEDKELLSSGAFSVIYDFSGFNPTCDNSVYNLWAIPNTNLGNITWTLSVSAQKAGFYLGLDNRLYAPSFLPFTEPQCFYIKAELSIGGAWWQPIYVARNSYAFTTLNNWTGALTINEENNYLLAAVLGAGKKNTNNQFSGVLMGTVGKDDFTSYTTGLYGFKDGQQVFKLDENGEFYIGNDYGYLEFREGQFVLAVQEFHINSDNLSIDSGNGIQAYDLEGREIFNLSASGENFRLGNFTINSQGFGDVSRFQTGGSGIWFEPNPTANSYFINCTNYGDSSKYFRVGGNGIVYAAGAEIEGTLKADSIIGNGAVNGGSLKILTEQDASASEAYKSKLYISQMKSQPFTYSNTVYHSEIRTSPFWSSLVHYQNNSSKCSIVVGGTGGFGGTWNFTSSAGTDSDYNLKHDIEPLSDKYTTFFDSLVPKRFKYNDGTSDRYHTGFIAQEVYEAFTNAGLNSQEVGAYVHFDKSTINEEHLALRYEEFIAINTMQIQMLKSRVAELEKEIREIKQNEI